MSSESYTPSEEEVKNAEASMDNEQAKLSETRESLIKKIKEESGLEGDIFDQLVESYSYDSDQNNSRRSFKVKGHDVIVMGEYSNSDKKNIFTTLRIDGIYLSNSDTLAFFGKYGKAMEGMDQLNNTMITIRTNEKTVKDALADLL